MFYYKQVKNGEIIGVESKSVNVASPGFIKAKKAEYDSFIASLPVVTPEIPRDLAREHDELRAELKEKGYIE